MAARQEEVMRIAEQLSASIMADRKDLQSRYWDCVKDASELKRTNDLNNELVNSRILFLLTYDTTQDFPELFREHQLAESIIKASNLDKNHSFSTNRRR
ncbi:MAG: hypothetical protein Q9164_007386 [Protoblastenia rupestris]